MKNRFRMLTLVVIVCVAFETCDSAQTRSQTRALIQQGCLPYRRIDTANIAETSPIIFYQTSPTNSRTEYAQACVGKEHLGTGSKTVDASRAYTQSMGGQKGVHDAGHIVANAMGGDVDERNLFPQLRGINRGAWREIERRAAAVVSSRGQHILYEVNLHYTNDNDTIPDKISYEIIALPNIDNFQGEWEVIEKGEMPNSE